MAKQIKQSDISEADLFGAIKKSAADTIGVLQKFNLELTKIAKESKTVAEKVVALSKTAEGLKKLNKAFADSNTVKKDAVKVDQELERLRKIETEANIKLEQLKQQEIRTEQAAFNLEAKKQAQKNNGVFQLKNETNAYKKLVIATRNQKNESKRLGATLLQLENSGKKNTKAYRDLKTQYNSVTRAAQNGDKQLKKLDKTVGDNFRNVGNYRSALGGLNKALGAVGLAVGIRSAIQNISGIVADFDQAQTDLAAISGKTADELAPLTAQAKELGATTQFSATQITGLQIELAKLGFTSQEISDSTGGIANFAAATGADIPAAAALAGSSLRAFGLDATEIDRVVSTLGVATTKTALDFGALETGLSTVAPVAKAFGFSIEDTTALLGQLANSGFDASSAATATRNILLNLADANGSLAKELGRPIKSADDLAAGLQELQARGIDLGAALELTDKRSVAAFQTFLDGSGSLVALRDSITDVNGELTDMADKRLDSVNGQLQLLSSAWEGFILGTNDATGAATIFKNAIGFVAENLGTILTTLGTIVFAYIKYIAVVKTVNALQFVFSGGLKTIGKNLVLGAKGMIGFANGTRTAGVAMKGLGRAMKSIPFVAIIGLLIDLAMTFYDVADAAAEARRQQELIDEGKQKSADFTSKIIQGEKAHHDDRMRRLDEEIRKRKAAGEDEQVLAAEKIKREEDITKETKKRIDDKAKQSAREFDILNQLKNIDERGTIEAIRRKKGSLSDIEKKDLKEFANLMTAASKFTTVIVEGYTLAEMAGKRNSDIITQERITRGENQRAFIAESEEYQKVLDENGVQQIELGSTQQKLYEDEKKRLNDRKKGVKGLTDAQKAQIKLLEDLKKAYNDLIDLEDAYFLRSQNEEEQAVIKRLQQLDQETAKVDASLLTSATEREDFIQKLITESEAEITAIRTKFRLEREAKSLEEEIAALELAYNKRLKVIAENELAGTLTEKQVQQDNLNAQIAFLLSKEQALKKAGKSTLEIEKEIIDARLALQKLGSEKEKATSEKDLAAQKKAAQERAQVAQAFNTAFSKAADERIKKIEDEISTAQKTQDTLQQLAADGNIDAKESIAEQAEIQRELQKQKERELKRKARVELASSAYAAYEQKVAAGSERPLAETIRDITLLQNFISTIPLFKEGTEDTGVNGRGVDGQGGFHAILHPNERVMTKEQNSLVGNLSNEQLAQIAYEYQNGKIIHSEGAVQLGNGWNTAAVIQKLDDLQRTIKNKPEYDIKVEEIINGTMSILKSKKENNSVIYNKYIIK